MTEKKSPRRREMEAALHKALSGIESYDPTREMAKAMAALDRPEDAFRTAFEADEHRRNLLGSVAVRMAEKMHRTAMEVEAMRREAFLRTADHYVDYTRGTEVMGAGPAVTTTAIPSHTYSLSGPVVTSTVAKASLSRTATKAMFIYAMSNGATPDVGMRVKHDGVTFIIDRIEIDTSGSTWAAVAVGHAVGDGGVFTAGRLLMRAPINELEPAEPEIKESAA